MDQGHTYSSKGLVQANVYAPEGFTPPPTFTLDWDGKPITFFRLSDETLTCGTVYGIKGACTNFECHRRELGECQCGRHSGSVKLAKAD